MIIRPAKCLPCQEQGEMHYANGFYFFDFAFFLELFLSFYFYISLFVLLSIVNVLTHMSVN